MPVTISQMQQVANGGSDSCAFVRVLTKELRFRIIIATPKEQETHEHRVVMERVYRGRRCTLPRKR